MVSESWFKQLDSVLSNSFSNLKYDVREIYRLINEIKNILIEAEPKNVKERVAVIENSLQDHIATLKTLEVVVAELKISIDEIKDSNNINNRGIEEISRNIGSLLIKNQRDLEKVSRSIEVMLKNDSERKKETKELRQALKSIERDVKKKPKIIRITAKASKKASKKRKAKKSRKHPKHASDKTEMPAITASQFQNPKKDGDPNGEWVEISGNGRMGGWTLEDKDKKHTYAFPAGFVLKGKVRVYSGKGKDTKTKLFWGNPTSVWNDEYDSCVLRNREGEIVSKAESKQVHDFEILK